MKFGLFTAFTPYKTLGPSAERQKQHSNLKAS